MAESLKARICNLILKLLAHTFGRLCALPAAGTVSSGALESFSDGIDNLLIGIELDFHVRHLFLDCSFIIPQDKVFFCDEVTLRQIFIYARKSREAVSYILLHGSLSIGFVVLPYSATENWSLPTEHKGHSKSSGISSHFVPGAMPPSG